MLFKTLQKVYMKKIRLFLFFNLMATRKLQKLYIWIVFGTDDFLDGARFQ